MTCSGAMMTGSRLTYWGSSSLRVGRWQQRTSLPCLAQHGRLLAWRVRRLLDATAARSIQSARAGGTSRYQFAHESLLVYAQSDEDLSDPDFRRRIHEWAEKWRTAGWPAAVGTEH